MSWERYPNANYPQGYDEANMIKTTDVPVNVEGGLLTVTEAGAGLGPLKEVTGADVRGVTIADTFLTTEVGQKAADPETDETDE